MVMEIILSVILLFVGVAVLVGIHVCIVGRAFRGEFENGRMVHGSSGRAKRMSNEDLKKLPSFDYKAAERGSSPVDCVVCLENFKVGDKCRSLPNCNHSFHAKCVDSWLLKTPFCPICRTTAHASKIGMILPEESSVSRDAGVELT